MPSSAAQLPMHHNSNSVKDDALVRRFTLAVVYAGTMQPARQGRRAAGAASLSMFLKTALTLTAVLAACQEGAATTNCKAGRCITIGSDSYCSDCALDAEAPINGACAVPSNQDVCVRVAGGRCVECATAAFMYMGGCYQPSTAPGNVMCKAATEGKCDTPADGKTYFVVPGATKTDQSVAACGDATTGVTIGGTKKYVGVADCTACTAEGLTTSAGGTAKCTTCNSGKIVKTDENGTTCIAEADCPTTNGYFLESGSPKNCKACAANCLTCTSAAETACQSCTANTYFLGAENGQAGKCVSCGDAVTGSGAWKGVAGCAKCTKPKTAGPATCTECASNYLKIESETTSCVDANACTGGFVPTTDSSGKKVCVSCGDKTNGGIENCSACTPIESPTTTVLVTCSACSQGKVSPGGSSCMTACPENSSEQSGACVCNSGFAPSGDKCTSSSANRSALSTGAIAGISVAAVVVVGGLVGFLCWWFICRGKA
ncbi:Variant-specific surface protein [Giardia duodenalis]|uniref:Variant-specific surface protein n=1 Tax=Giardia intestinalis TaxID=5741 RepID=V6TTD7_GIAIN|nr:Variant-specific surface protein [Giardia intestinalis]